ncbi:MAG: co-chaperone HscB [Aliiglaciecola sp.]
MNFFTLFGLPEQFKLDKNHLANVYKSLAQVTHPDKFSTASEQQKLLSVQKSSQVNDGYNVLKHPLSRAEHMLELRGLSLQHETKTLQDPAFLMQQMEWREQLEDAQYAKEPMTVLEDLEQELQTQTAEQYKILEDLLVSSDEQSNQKAAAEIRKLKFMHKLLSEIARKEEEWFDDF